MTSKSISLRPNFSLRARWFRGSCAWGLGVALLVFSVSARGQSSEADEKFEQGRELFEQGRFSEACQKFELSQQLDPSPGTLLNLGNCYEPQGDLLRALAIFEEALEGAEQAVDPRRRRIWSGAARERIASLKTRIPSLTLAGLAAGSQVQVDGTAVKTPVERYQLDPGSHRLVVSAPGKKSLSRDFDLKVNGRLELHIAPLARIDNVSLEGPSSPSNSVLNAPPLENDTAAGGFGIWPWVVGGSGVALIAASIIPGSLARDKAGKLDEQCGEAKACDRNSRGLHDEATSLALTSDVLWITGAVFLGVGVTLFVFDGYPGAEGIAIEASCQGLNCGLDVSGYF